MKKQILILCASFCLIFCLAGCGDNSGQQAATNDQGTLPEGNYSELGDGTLVITTSSGTSEDGNTPYVFYEADTVLSQIGLDAWEFDGSHLSYIYIDGMLNETKQLADSQITLSLTDNLLNVGIHKVEVVQYSTDKPEGEIILYKTASYEIKQP